MSRRRCESPRSKRRPSLHLSPNVRHLRALEPLETRLLLSGAITAVHSFSNVAQWAPADAPIVVDAAGDIFGTTSGDGAFNAGTIFEIPAATHLLKTLVSLPGNLGGQGVGQLSINANGDLFGVLNGFSAGGIIYEVPAGSGSLFTIASFPAPGDTALSIPDSGVLLDAVGNLFGTTQDGGDYQNGGIYELPAGTSTPITLASFTEPDTSNNYDGIALDPGGNLFGVSQGGGSAGDGYLWQLACGTNAISEISFTGDNGSSPTGRPISDADGNIFGTTSSGGASGYGTVYELPAGSSTLRTVASCMPYQGIEPAGGLAIDAAGNLWGTTSLGGPNTDGEIFEIPADVINTGDAAITPFAAFDGSQGGVPPSAISFDAAGNLYGRTNAQGAKNNGAIYELSAAAIADGPAVGTGNGADDFLALAPPTPGIGSTLSLSVGVSLRNPDGSLLTSGAGHVAISILTGPGTLSGTTTVNLVNGAATFTNLQFSTAGNYTLQASSVDVVSSNPVDAGSLAVAPGVIARLAFAQQPASSIAGASLPTFSVAAQDAYGEPITSTGNVTLIVQSGPGTPAGTLVAAPVNGLATFSNVTLTAAGTYTLAATDTADGATPAISASFTITPAAPTHLDFLSTPAELEVGAPISPILKVAIEDAYNNIVTADNSTISLATATGPASPTGTLSVVATNGIASFPNLLFTTAGTYTLTASDNADNLTAISGSISVVPGATPHIAFTQQPTTVATGAPFNVQVLVTDPQGNPLNGTVSLAIDQGASPGLLGGTTQVDTVNGLATFSNLTFSSPGTYTLRASMGTLTVDSATIQVNTIQPSTPAARLALAQSPPRTIAAGTFFNASIQLLDSKKHPTTASGSTITATLVGRGGTLQGTTTVTVINGIATFSNLSLQKAGTYSLRFSDGSLKPVTFSHLTVTADPSTAKLLLVRPPASTVTVGARLTGPVIQATDAYGNLLTSKITVTLSIHDNPTAIKGATTVPLKKGLAAFRNLSFTAAGDFTIDVTSPGLPSVSFAETVAPATVTLPAPRIAASYASTTPIVLSIRALSSVRTLPLTSTLSLLDAANTTLATSPLTRTGTTRLTLTTLLPGTYTCHLHYPGDPAHDPADSSPFTLTVQ